MGRFLLGRLLSGIVTVWFIATATFVAMHAVPGDPLLNERAMSPELRRNLAIEYGLDQPLAQQYLRYMGSLARGDLGVSFTQQHRRVNDVIREHFAVSAQLGLLAIAIAVCGGILFGALAARSRGRWGDRAIMLAVVLCISVPGFVFAALAQLGILRLNAWLGFPLLPVAGWGGIDHMLAPALVLGLGTLAYLTRLMRTSLREIESAGYLQTARARGLSPARIFFQHQLRNALLPLLTVLGPAIAAITTGGFVVELVFAIPGLGRYFVQAVQQLDYTMIMGTTVFYGAFLVTTVLTVDVVQGILDPRIRLARRA